MRDSRLLILVSGLFIQLGVTLPFYLPGGEWGQLPLGMSFLADGIFLLFLGLLVWVFETIQEVRDEDNLEKWIEKRNLRFGNTINN